MYCVNIPWIYLKTKMQTDLTACYFRALFNLVCL